MRNLFQVQHNNGQHESALDIQCRLNRTALADRYALQTVAEGGDLKVRFLFISSSFETEHVVSDRVLGFSLLAEQDDTCMFLSTIGTHSTLDAGLIIIDRTDAHINT